MTGTRLCLPVTARIDEQNNPKKYYQWCHVSESKYKQRKLMRLRGHSPALREPPRYYAEFMADFALREKEQNEAARRGPLSPNPLQPWGNRRLTREEVAELEALKQAEGVAAAVSKAA